MTFVSLILMFIGKKFNLSDRILIKESLNQESFKGVVALIKRICKYTFILETIGTVILAIRFIPQYGIKTGIFYSIFHSISAFCNAGFDILGSSSFMNYSSDLLVNITIMMLIIIGGLGFTVWTDILNSLKKGIKEKLNPKKILKIFSLHTKLVLTITVILLVTGTLSIYLLEYNTLMKNDNQGTKILKAAFQATTLRTAGFSTIVQNELTTAGKFISICYMFVGGSPTSTAGGIKTTTLAILILYIVNFISGKNEITVFKKSIPFEVIRRAVVIFIISVFIVTIAVFGMLVSENSLNEGRYSSEVAEYKTFTFLEVFFEVVSAFGTVGLSLGITNKLSVVGKIIISLLMIIGRLGPITITIALFKNKKEKNENSALHPQGNVLVG